MNYSLASRDFITNMFQIQGEATPFDAAVFTASCDKAIPACLKAIARMNMPSVFIPGGKMCIRDRSLIISIKIRKIFCA